MYVDFPQFKVKNVVEKGVETSGKVAENENKLWNTKADTEHFALSGSALKALLHIVLRAQNIRYTLRHKLAYIFAERYFFAHES